MADFLESPPTCEGNWTKDQLDAFNITVVDRPAEEFFGRPLPQKIDVPRDILESPDMPKDIRESLHRPREDVIDFFKYMKPARIPSPWQKNDVNGFARHLLWIMKTRRNSQRVGMGMESGFEHYADQSHLELDFIVVNNRIMGEGRYPLRILVRDQSVRP